MTLAELRELAEAVQRIPCVDPSACDPELLEYNHSVGRFRELVALVRNRLVTGGPDAGAEPAGAAEVRELASKLEARHRQASMPWALAAPPDALLEATPSRRR